MMRILIPKKKSIRIYDRNLDDNCLIGVTKKRGGEGGEVPKMSSNSKKLSSKKTDDSDHKNSEFLSNLADDDDDYGLLKRNSKSEGWNKDDLYNGLEVKNGFLHFDDSVKDADLRRFQSCPGYVSGKKGANQEEGEEDEESDDSVFNFVESSGEFSHRSVRDFQADFDNHHTNNEDCDEISDLKFCVCGRSQRDGVYKLTSTSVHCEREDCFRSVSDSIVVSSGEGDIGRGSSGAVLRRHHRLFASVREVHYNEGFRGRKREKTRFEESVVQKDSPFLFQTPSPPPFAYDHLPALVSAQDHEPILFDGQHHPCWYFPSFDFQFRGLLQQSPPMMMMNQSAVEHRPVFPPAYFIPPNISQSNEDNVITGRQKEEPGYYDGERWYYSDFGGMAPWKKKNNNYRKKDAKKATKEKSEKIHCQVQPFDPYAWKRYCADGWMQKYLCTFFVGVEDDSDFRVAKRLIGPRGAYMREIADASGGKLRLRGRGSGYLERDYGGNEARECLQICGSCPFKDGYERMKEQVSALLDKIHSDHKKIRGYLPLQKWYCLEHPSNNDPGRNGDKRSLFACSSQHVKLQ